MAETHGGTRCAGCVHWEINSWQAEKKLAEGHSDVAGHIGYR
jgi:hypothetical protein